MRLLKLEMKRVLKTKLNIMLLFSALFLAFVMAYLPITYVSVTYLDENETIIKLKGMEALQYSKNLQSEISGIVTTEKVKWAFENYQTILQKYGVTDSYDLPDGVYGTELLPYYPLLHGLQKVFDNPFMIEIDPQQIDDYYGSCETYLESLIQQKQGKHPAAQQIAANLYRQVTKPYLFYSGYSTDAIDYQVLLGFLILCICAVIAAPVFTSDYQTGADDILRCTKYGRTNFALTKIISAFLICGSIMALCSIIYIVVSNSLFGWESTKTSIQMFFSIVNLLDMNIGNVQWFMAISGLLSILATISFILFLSSKCKNVVVSLSMALVCCILPTVIYMAFPPNIGEWIYSMIPSSGAGIQTSFLYSAVDFTFLNIGNFSIWLPHAMLIACIIEIPLFTILTVHSYSKHHAI